LFIYYYFFPTVATSGYVRRFESTKDGNCLAGTRIRVYNYLVNQCNPSFKAKATYDPASGTPFGLTYYKDDACTEVDSGPEFHAPATCEAGDVVSTSYEFSETLIAETGLYSRAWYNKSGSACETDLAFFEQTYTNWYIFFVTCNNSSWVLTCLLVSLTNTEATYHNKEHALELLEQPSHATTPNAKTVTPQPKSSTTAVKTKPAMFAVLLHPTLPLPLALATLEPPALETLATLEIVQAETPTLVVIQILTVLPMLLPSY